MKPMTNAIAILLHVISSSSPPLRAEAREGEENDGEKFGVEDAAEKFRRAVEIQQNSVHDADVHTPFQNLFVAVPIDVYNHEQNAERPHKIHDFGQPPQIVFLLHAFRCLYSVKRK